MAQNPFVNRPTSDEPVPHLREAVARRLPLLGEREAVRLAHHEPIDGLTIDDYGGWLLLTDYRGLGRRHLTEAAETTLDALGEAGLPAHGALAKHRPDNLSHKPPADASAPIRLAGDPPPARFTIGERGMRFVVSLSDAGFGTGVFLDMAEGRATVRALAGRCPEVLNLFSYTGPFSIAAAAGGAERIIEVDTSRKWLAWSRENQAANALPEGRVRQRCEDAVKYLGRQDEASFDLIISDPPSYANPRRGKRFTIEAGYRAMAGHFERVLRPGGYLLACCNHAQTPGGRFRQWLPRGLRFERWVAMAPDFGRADYLKVALLRRPPRHGHAGR